MCTGGWMHATACVQRKTSFFYYFRLFSQVDNSQSIFISLIRVEGCVDSWCRQENNLSRSTQYSKNPSVLHSYQGLALFYLMCQFSSFFSLKFISANRYKILPHCMKSEYHRKRTWKYRKYFTMLLSTHVK